VQTGHYLLYAHPDLVLSSSGDGKRRVLVLGDVYDSHEPQKGNEEIASDILLASADTLERLLCHLSGYAGTYAVILDSDEHSVVVTDARGLREVYYHTGGGSVLCASQPHVLAQRCPEAAAISDDPTLLAFYRRELWDSRWIGDGTYFKSIRHLLPNHYLDLRTRRAHRYWPVAPLQPCSLDDAVEECCRRLENTMRAVTERHRCMMAVTAGTDSRVLLAAARGRAKDIYCFINDHNLGSHHPDIRVPKQMLEAAGIEFHIHQVPDTVDEDFRRIFLQNTFLASERLLPSIYNVFFGQHQGRVLILGVSEIGRTFFGSAPKHLTSFRMAYKLGYPNSQYVIRECERIRLELQALSREYGVNPLSLLYWEQRLGNWGATRNSESNIAVEKVDPFNSRALYELFHRVDERYRSYRDNPCVLLSEVIRRLWPELLQWPVNPPGTRRDWVMGVLERAHVFEAGKELKYRVSEACHRLRRAFR